jgi:hypothetical protein
MDHLIIPLPAAIAEAAEDADPALSAYVRRTPLGWWSLAGGPVPGVVALADGPLAALVVGLLGTATILGLLLIGHARHRRAVEADPRTGDVRTARRLVEDFNSLAPRLGALIRSPPPDTAELFSEARQLRMDVQGIVGLAESAVAQQPRLGSTGLLRGRVSPVGDDRSEQAQARIASLAERLAEEEALPPGVLRFPRRA